MTKTLSYWFLNGQKLELIDDSQRTLISYLREDKGIFSVKHGCDHGECGACTVLIDGQPTLACRTYLSDLAGKNVLTLEGLPADIRQSYMRLFSSNSQTCYFCLPGLTMRLYAFLQKNPTPSRKELQKLLSKHLCHCNGYISLNESLQRFIQPKYKRKHYEIIDHSKNTKIPILLKTPSSFLKEIFEGKARYVTDMEAKELLHGVFITAPYPHGRLLAIDPSEALEIKGVTAVLLANDWPPFFRQGDFIPKIVGIGEEMTSISDVLGLVLATSPQAARAGAEMVIVDIEEYEPLTNIEYLHQQEDEYLLARTHITRGDTTQAFHKSAFIFSGTWRTPMKEIAFLPLPAVMARLDEKEKLFIYTHNPALEQVETLLELLLDDDQKWSLERRVPDDRAKDVPHPSLELYAAYLAVTLKRPVKIALSREDTFLLSPKSPAMRTHLTLSCDEKGNFTGMKARILTDNGAFSPEAQQILKRTAIHACGPYRIPNFDILAEAIRTNHPPTTMTSTSGITEITFALEGAINLLARQIKLDSWEIRYRNALTSGDILPNGQLLTKDFHFIQSLEAIRDIYYKYADRAGLACGMLGHHSNERTNRLPLLQLHITTDENIALQLPPQNLGQEFYRALLRIAAEESNIPLERFQLIFDKESNFAALSPANPASAILLTQATRYAARQLKAELDAKKDLHHKIFIGYSPLPFYESPHPENASLPFFSHFAFAAHLAVLHPSQGHIERYIAVHDLSGVPHPNEVLQKLEAGIYTGLSHALTEQQIFKNAAPQNLTIKDLNPIEPTHIPYVKFQLLLNNLPHPEKSRDINGKIAELPVAPTLADAISKREELNQYSLPMKMTVTAMAHQPPSQKF